MPERLTVFISSPADVADERLYAHLIVAKLAREYRSFFAIEPYRWDHDEAMLADRSFQDSIRLPSSCDIVVLILWSRIGSPLPPKTDVRAYQGMDGRTPVTGTEWEWEEALKATKDRGAPDLLAFRNNRPAQIPTQQDERQQNSIAQLDALNNFWRRHFEGGGQFTVGSSKYEQLDEFARKFEIALRALIVKRIRGPAAPVWLGVPFRGLESYDFKDAPIFFGRDAAVAKAVEQLTLSARCGCAFLLVCGASGTGKSSLVKAGVLPSLMLPDVLSDTAFVRRVVFKPGAERGNLFLGLAKALTQKGETNVGLPELLAPGQEVAELARHLRAAADPSYLFANALGHAAAQEHQAKILASGKTPKLILVIDQLEELFTLADVAVAERRRFIQLLSWLASSGTVWVIATLRNDFWPRAVEDVPALIALADGQRRMDVARPSQAEITDMIRLPAQAAGLTFDAHPETKAGLDLTMAGHAGNSPGVLPLLSFVLEALYEKAKQRDERVLSHQAYSELGELHGAIAVRAGETLAALAAEAQVALPRVLRTLVTVGHDGEAAAARTAPLDGFAADSAERALINAFVEARLFVSDSAEGGTTSTIRVAHEALLKHWRAAGDQIRQDKNNLQVRARLQQAEALWRVNRDDGRLLAPGEPLTEAEALLHAFRGDLSGTLIDFIERSRERVALLRAAQQFRDWVAALRQQNAREDNLSSALEPNSPQGRLARASRLLGTAQQAGMISERETAAQEAIAILDDLMQAEPRQWQPRQLLAICRMTLGDLALAKGDSTAAGAAYQQAEALLDDGATDDADGVEAQRRRAVMRMRQYDLMAQQGKVDEALEAYRGCLADQQQLAEREPSHSGLQEDLCRLHAVIGSLLLRRGDIGNAIVSFRVALQAGEPLTWQVSGKPDFQVHLASVHESLGFALHAQDQSNSDHVESALAAYARSRTIMQNLDNLYPGYPPYRRQLAMVAVRIGGLLHQQDKPEEAIRACSEAAENLRRLAAQDNSNIGYKRGLALALHRLGEVSLREDAAAALAACRECRDIRQDLQRLDAANLDLAFDLAATDGMIATALAELGNREEAISTARRGVQSAAAACVQAGSNPERRQQLAFLHVTLADIHRRAGNALEAAAECRKAIVIHKAIIDEQPENPRWIREALYAHEKLAELEPDRARRQLNQALDHAHDLIRLEGSQKARNELARLEGKLNAVATP